MFYDLNIIHSLSSLLIFSIFRPFFSFQFNTQLLPFLSALLCWYHSTHAREKCEIHFDSFLNTLIISLCRVSETFLFFISCASRHRIHHVGIFHCFFAIISHFLFIPSLTRAGWLFRSIIEHRMLLMILPFHYCRHRHMYHFRRWNFKALTFFALACIFILRVVMYVVVELLCHVPGLLFVPI